MDWFFESMLYLFLAMRGLVAVAVLSLVVANWGSAPSPCDEVTARCRAWPLATQTQSLWCSDLVALWCMRARSLQLYLTHCNPIDCSPPGSSVRGISPGKNTGVGGHALPPGDLPDPGIGPASLMSPALAGGLFTSSVAWEALAALWHVGSSQTQG